MPHTEKWGYLKEVKTTFSLSKGRQTKASKRYGQKVSKQTPRMIVVPVSRAQK